mmetsp:Transcript_29722/g.95103  ORF Transcript_29722/g.95103 Transcript_29722/m.95103 type:complete len:244 (-) Transcript_29722:382-1113(-)
MPPSAAHFLDVCSSPQTHNHRRHLAVLLVAMPELAVAIVTPGEDLRSVRDGDIEVGPAGEAGDLGSDELGDPLWSSTPFLVSVSQLPVVVQPPGPQGANVGHPQRMVLPSSHRPPSLPVPWLLHLHWLAAALELPRPQLAACSVPPSKQLPALHHSKRVVVPGSHRHAPLLSQPADLAGLRHRLEVSQPQPATRSQTPRVHRPVQAPHEVVGVTACHLHHPLPAEGRHLLRLWPSLPPFVPIL